MNTGPTMSPELQEMYNFLKDIRPFSALSDSQLQNAASSITISYHRAGSDDQILDYEHPTLFIVRSGVFDVKDQQGELIDRVSTGGFFGFVSLLTGSSKGHTLSVYEDGLLYRIEQSVFQKLRYSSTEFDQHFTQAFENRLRVGLKRRNENIALSTKISDVMPKQLYGVPETSSILDAARLMSEKDIASVVVFNESQSLAGIFTDKDCRKRVIANQVDSTSPISEVMTANPYTINETDLVHEATVIMMRHQIKHLPVVRDSVPVSMVTLSDLIRLQRSDPVLIINEIYRATNNDDLVKICKKIPDLLLHLIKVDVRADDLGRILTSVTGALTRRLIQLAQDKYGKEPVPFVWIAFGSQGRQDQSAKSDQDNGLLLANEAKQEHDAYFEKLAKFVNHGLDACGYVYCPGDIMAQNKKWRQTLTQWKKTFALWITEPTAKALMHTSIFFDMRAIHTSKGAEGMLMQMQNSALALAKNNSMFLALLTQNALDLRPPLGFFQTLVVDSNGEHKNTFNIKLRGIMPINDIARIHALANGVEAVNTRERIKALIKMKAVTKTDGTNLLDAHEYIAHQRLLHQGQQMSQGYAPDNHLPPSSFSSLTVRHLKDAFKVVRDAQAGLKQRYASALG